MNTIPEFITRDDVRRRTKWSFAFIDRHLPRIKVGGKVLIRVDALNALLGGAKAPGGQTPPYRELAFKLQSFWLVNEQRPACNDKADILTDTVKDFLKIWPDGDVNSSHFIAYSFAHPPVGGGDVGDAVRTDIREEAKKRGLLTTRPFH